MVSTSITSVDAPIVQATTRPALSSEIVGVIAISGTADSGTIIRITVDGTRDTAFEGYYNVAQGGHWSISNVGSNFASGGPSVKPGVHTLVASSYVSDASLIPYQTSAPVKVALGTNGADTLYGPALSSSIDGPTSLIGYYGDDRFIAYTVANDASGYHATGAKISISGGYDPGVDTVVLPVALSDGVTMVLQHPFQTIFTITTPDAVIDMRNIEKLAFTDLTITVQASVLNDFLYYDSRYRDLAVADVNAQQHYEASGWREGRDPNAFFSTTGYLASNPDIAAAGINPLAHYDAVGWKEGRDPSAAFDTSLYLRFNPDVAASGLDPLAHYLAIGRGEGRKASPVVDSANLTATGFDPTYYKLANPDVAKAGVDLQQHYLSIGFKEGRNPDAFFDTVAYLRASPDVAAAGLNPLLHYMTEGWREGRDPSSHFDTSAYLAANPDVAAASVNPLEHFLQSGITEGRSAYGDLF